jgi:hypothetical protein
MSGENKDLLERYLRETKAKTKVTSFGDFVARMKSEQEFRKLLSSLRDSIHSEEIFPFLISDEKGAESPPDFIVWKDEFRIPLFLVESEDKDTCTISRKKIEGLLRYLKRTSLIEALIVWMHAPNFPSVLLSVEEIERKAKSPNELYTFTNLQSFENTVVESMKTKETVWPVPKLGAIPQAIESETLLSTLESTFEQEFRRAVIKKRPRLSYKRQALESIKDEDATEIFSMIASYLKGELNMQDFAKRFRSMAKYTKKSLPG